jgi:cell division septal protein FtsQ
MTRKQARRKKQKKAAWFKMPRIRVAHVVAPLVAVGAVIVTYLASASMLDRPIRSIEISGPFQRVTALQIEEAISDEMTDGFVSADLAVIQRRIVELPWIDQAMASSATLGTSPLNCRGSADLKIAQRK